MLLTTCGFYELRSFRPVSWHSSRDQPCLRQRKVPGYYELSVQLTFQSLSTHMMFTLERLAHKAFFLRFGMSSECPALHCLCSCAKGILPQRFADLRLLLYFEPVRVFIILLVPAQVSNFT